MKRSCSYVVQGVLIMSIVVATAVSLVAPPTEYFVKPAAEGGDDGNDGLSWATALASPQAAFLLISFCR